jgi:nitroreductase
VKNFINISFKGTDMNLWEAIYNRRSVRKFLTTPVEFDKLIEVIRAGSYAPCAGNLQNWKFILETNPDTIRGMYHHTLEQEPFLTATAAIVVVAETEEGEKFYGMRGKRLYAIQNCAAAIQNMLLAAYALGLGAVWIGAFDENRINDMYKIPSVARAQAIILLGYPAEEPTPRHMKNVWYLVNFSQYGLKYDNTHRITHDWSVEWARQGADWKRIAERYTTKAMEKAGIEGEPKNLGDHLSKQGKGLFQKARKHAEKMIRGEKEEKKRQTKPRFIESLKKPSQKRRG